jgi:hypothetical protein
MYLLTADVAMRERHSLRRIAAEAMGSSEVAADPLMLTNAVEKRQSAR